jgi:multidrug efflux pump subunit AcrA (membrane-fusion protein)
MMTSNFKTLNQKHKWLLPVLILIIAVLIITALVATKPQPPKKETTEKSWLVSSEPLKFRSVSPNIALLGHVESPFDSKLSAAINSDVLSVPVRDGQIVSQGQVLITLDAREIKLYVAQRQADVDELSAQIIAENNRYNSDKSSLVEEQKLLDIATQGVKRQLKLQKSKLGSQERVDSAETLRAQKSLSLNARKLNIADHPSRSNQLTAGLNRAQTLLSDAKIDVERTLIIAPFDGVITAVNVAPGERVQLGQTLVSLYDRKNIEVRAQLPNRYVALVKASLAQGDLIQASTESYGITNQLELKRLSGQANQSTGGIDALFTPLIPTELKPSVLQTTETLSSTLILNSTLKVQVTLPPLQNVATLPLSAIYGSDRIYRIEDGRLQSINVTILGKQLSSTGGQDRVIIQSNALKDGDMITTTQLPTAISGLKVIEREL